MDADYPLRWVIIACRFTVLGHELSHIKNKDIMIGTLAATMSGAVAMVASVARGASLFGGVQVNG